MRKAILSATLGFALCSSQVALAADPDNEARERYERALKLYEDGVFDAALVEFKRAAELRPSYKLLYNIAQVQMAMNDYASALDAYQQYLEQGGDKISKARRDAVKKEIEVLILRVATLTIESDVTGAEVSVDDKVVGKTPLSVPVTINSGIRRLVVRHPDYPAQSRQVSIAGGVQERVSFVFTRQGAERASQAGASGRGSATAASPSIFAERHEPTPAPSAERKSNVPWLGWALTGTLAAAAGVTGVLALVEQGKLEDARAKAPNNRAALDEHSSNTRVFAVLTDGFAVAALVAGGLSLRLTLTADEEERENAASSTRVHLDLSPTGAGVNATF